MSLISILKRNAKKYLSDSNSLFFYEVDKQKSYLKRFDEPKDDIERSYFQYKCQMKLMHPILQISLQTFSLVMLGILRLQKFVALPEKESCDALFISEGIPSTVIPETLIDEFRNLKIIKNVEDAYLDIEDRKFLRQISRRYPFSFYFRLKILLKMRMYSAWRHIYKPRAIIVCSEYSFTSSVMTRYCEQYSIEHINVMHGEKLFYIRDTFFRFNRCYIWDDFYKELFAKLRAADNQFIEQLPQSMKFDAINTEKQCDYTFYLGQESTKQLEKISGYCMRLTEMGNAVMVRPHPRYSNMEELKKYFDLEIIEDDSLSIEESIMGTKYVVSLYSTVLNQALHNQISIVIDDMTEPEKFRKLRELEFICLNKPHTLLSETLRSNDENNIKKNDEIFLHANC